MRLVCVAIVVMMAGCVNQPPAASVPETAQAAQADLEPGQLLVSGLYARYQADTDEVTVKLEPARETLLANGSLAPGFALLVDWKTSDAQTGYRYWIDENWRVIRRDAVCWWQQNDECITTAEWAYGGQLPPFGLLYRHFVTNGTIDTNYGGVPTQVGVEASAQELTIKGELDRTWWMGGQFRYRDADDVPIQMTLRLDGKATVFTLVEYHQGQTIGTINQHPERSPLNDGQLEKFYQGFAEDRLGRGYTSKQAMEWLLRNNEEARALDDGGCLGSVVQGPTTAYNAANALLSDQRTRGTTKIAYHDQGSTYTWSVSFVERLDGTTYFRYSGSSGEPEVTQSRKQCPEGGPSTHRIGVEDVATIMARMPWTMAENTTHVTFSERHRDGGPEATFEQDLLGWHEEPEWIQEMQAGFIAAYFARFDLGHGWLDKIQANEKTIAGINALAPGGDGFTA